MFMFLQALWCFRAVAGYILFIECFYWVVLLVFWRMNWCVKCGKNMGWNFEWLCNPWNKNKTSVIFISYSTLTFSQITNALGEHWRHEKRSHSSIDISGAALPKYSGIQNSAMYYINMKLYQCIGMHFVCNIVKNTLFLFQCIYFVCCMEKQKYLSTIPPTFYNWTPESQPYNIMQNERKVHQTQ